MVNWDAYACIGAAAVAIVSGLLWTVILGWSLKTFLIITGLAFVLLLVTARFTTP